MPQMSPMLWLILFLYFVLVFMLFISNLYFIYSPSSVVFNMVPKVSHSSLSWSW